MRLWGGWSLSQNQTRRKNRMEHTRSADTVNNLQKWAQRWGIPAKALTELATMHQHTPGAAGTGEGDVLNAIRLDASKQGVLLWRNNLGVAQRDDGRWIRYGLANDSRVVNAAFKSSDLVGVRPVSITPQHVGKTIGQFVAIEVKRGGWKYKGNDREKAQLAFLNAIEATGGYAKFATGVDKLWMK